MRNSKAVFSEIISGIQLNDLQDEKNAVAAHLMDHLFGISRAELMMDKPLEWTTETDAQVNSYLSRINNGEPVQYVTGEAWFLGFRYKVDPDVLIPRPETEELVLEAISHLKLDREKVAHVVDVGTGSGCIAISLTLKTSAVVYGTDVSSGALRVAKENARTHNAEVTFIEQDILHDQLPFSAIDVLISNPPYIAQSEKGEMKQNVTRYEPHQALFVPDEDPLLFYRRIGLEGKRILKKGGMIIVEINERFGSETADLMRSLGYIEVTILNDLSGKNRIVKAYQP